MGRLDPIAPRVHQRGLDDPTKLADVVGPGMAGQRPPRGGVELHLGPLGAEQHDVDQRLEIVGAGAQRRQIDHAVGPRGGQRRVQPTLAAQAVLADSTGHDEPDGGANRRAGAGGQPVGQGALSLEGPALEALDHQGSAALHEGVPPAGRGRGLGRGAREQGGARHGRGVVEQLSEQRLADARISGQEHAQRLLGPASQSGEGSQQGRIAGDERFEGIGRIRCADHDPSS